MYEYEITRPISIRYHNSGFTSGLLRCCLDSSSLISCAWRKTILLPLGILILFSYDGNQLSTSSIVKLIDTFYYNNQVYLLLADLLSDKVLLLNHGLNNVQPRCKWKLFDVASLRDILFANDELNYPERTYHNNDDLLELDYE